MPTPKREFIETRFGQMHVRIASPETMTASVQRPLICLHMTPQSGRNFDRFMRIVSEDRLVIAPDYHGYGESDPPPENPPVSIGDYAGTIWEALDVMSERYSDLESVNILGHHTGSKVAVEMARQRPQSVNALVLISVSISPEDAVFEPKEFAPLAIDDNGDFLKSWWMTLHNFYTEDFPKTRLMEQFSETLRPGSAFHWGFRAAHNYNAHFRRYLAALPHPVMIVNPQDDLYTITPEALNVTQKGRLIERPVWRHGFWDHNTQDVVETVRDVLSDL